LSADRGEGLDILPASQRVDERNWYLGTADAVYQNIDIIESYGPEYILILAGDHVYKQDYEPMLLQHLDSGADVTVGCIEVPREEATAFGVMHVDATDRIVDFVEKPADPPGMPDDPSRALASMGIYVFRVSELFEHLRADAADPQSSHDFGKDIIPKLVREGKAMAHRFSQSCVRSETTKAAYWRDVGTIDAYWRANIDLTDFDPDLDLYDRNWPIWTYAEITPPAKFVHDAPDRRGSATSSMVTGGCVVSGSHVDQSLLFTGVRCNSYSALTRVVALPQVDIGRHARLSDVVIDRAVAIPEGLVVGEDPVEDARRFRRTDNGVVLITQPMIDALDG
jgi:glucose-1-phosphate adenylyltransferase